MDQKRGYMNNGEVNENYIVSSLVRGFQILSAFTPNRPVLRVSEIAEITGIDQATAYRFVYTLEKLGYLVRDEQTKRYHQSVRMLTLGLPARLGVPVRAIAIPTMFELCNKIREIVNLCVLDDVDTVTIATAEIQERFVFSTAIGHRSPGFCTAAGRIMLAYEPVETWDRLISRMELTPYTQKTIVDPARLREELTKARKQGYAIQEGELVENVGSVAAPIFDSKREVAAAVEVTSYSEQIIHNGEKRDAVISGLLDISETISYRLGHNLTKLQDQA